MSNLEQLILDLKASLEHELGEIRLQIAGIDQRLAGLDQRVSVLDQSLSGFEPSMVGLSQRVSDIHRHVQDNCSHTQNLERLIVDCKESLERQIAAAGERTRKELRDTMEEIKSRFDIQAARLERQAGL